MLGECPDNALEEGCVGRRSTYRLLILLPVVNPPMEAAAISRRQLLVFFHNPNYDAVIECIPSCQSPDNPPKYAVTTSGEHWRTQFVRTQTEAGR
jgi:isopenicillin N synthase-like dioxygenase